jgi:hypothetical protein
MCKYYVYICTCLKRIIWDLKYKGTSRLYAILYSYKLYYYIDKIIYCRLFYGPQGSMWFQATFLVINIFFRYPTDCWYVHKIQTALSSEWRLYNWVWREEVLYWCKSIFRSWCKLYSQVIYHLRMMSLSKSIFRSWCKLYSQSFTI